MKTTFSGGLKILFQKDNLGNLDNLDNKESIPAFFHLQAPVWGGSAGSVAALGFRASGTPRGRQMDILFRMRSLYEKCVFLQAKRERT